MSFNLKKVFNSIKHLYYSRSIMTSSVNLEKIMENLQKNPYYEKYADRIATLQKTSPEEFLQRVENRFKSKDEKIKDELGSCDTRQFSSILHPKKALNDTSPGAPVQELKLDAIFKTDLVSDKNASEIQAIWEEYHKHKEVISATIPVNLYSSILQTTKEYPTFLFPLPRSQGYEFIMCQCSGHSVHFTSLLAFQVHKENAPECLKMVHYTELSGKGIVLMRGEYDKNVLSPQEAQCLANQFQMYYNRNDERKLHLLESFNKKPESFKHMELISQLENIGLV